MFIFSLTLSHSEPGYTWEIGADFHSHGHSCTNETENSALLFNTYLQAPGFGLGRNQNTDASGCRVRSDAHLHHKSRGAPPNTPREWALGTGEQPGAANPAVPPVGSARWTRTDPAGTAQSGKSDCDQLRGISSNSVKTLK